MAEPDEKTPQMEKALTDMFGVDRVGSIKADKCVMCEGDATEFSDELSRKEYTISGLCQDCQDEFFREDS